ncbi:MAG: hypothetical protein R3C45_01420 [Phycisphaerales bacterium]
MKTMSWPGRPSGRFSSSPGLQEALQARLAALLEAGPEEEPQRLNATDLSRIRTKRFTTWMDHRMALLMDSESYPEDVPTFDDDSQAKLVVPCSDRAMWLMSLTEFDVKLEFIVQATVPQPRKVWWQRMRGSDIGTHGRATTGTDNRRNDAGDRAAAGRLPYDCRASCTKDSDPLAESAEMIQVTLVPMGTG